MQTDRILPGHRLNVCPRGPTGGALARRLPLLAWRDRQRLRAIHRGRGPSFLSFKIETHRLATGLDQSLTRCRVPESHYVPHVERFSPCAGLPVFPAGGVGDAVYQGSEKGTSLTEETPAAGLNRGARERRYLHRSTVA
ncbi:hypothetical protein AAFF_G00305850 [Aldrovandia affinis]|uniref:Uncharacterized protein n=1 Tax=Aldrovandia affinis TaxID=143900 RepID=A0AAD7SPH0_9TELE|nr:hypothetical protein AAFF_G00305850 [Aldrovandia affinis]